MSNASRRIASLLASGTEILYGLDLGDRVVAVSHECDYPSSVAGKPRVTVSHVAAPTSGAIDTQVREMLAAGHALYGIDAATLAALAPDLIVTQAQCDVCAVKYEDVLALVRDEPALRDTRVVALNPMTLADIFADIMRLGEATGAVRAAQKYLATLQNRVTAIREKTARLSPGDRPRVAAIEWIEPLMLAGNWMPELLELAGGVQPLKEHGHHSTYNDWQSVVDFDPQVVLVMPCGFDLARALVESDALFLPTALEGTIRRASRPRFRPRRQRLLQSLRPANRRQPRDRGRPAPSRSLRPAAGHAGRHSRLAANRRAGLEGYDPAVQARIVDRQATRAARPGSSDLRRTGQLRQSAAMRRLARLAQDAPPAGLPHIARVHVQRG